MQYIFLRYLDGESRFEKKKTMTKKNKKETLNK